jgi:hypothetical protein
MTAFPPDAYYPHGTITGNQYISAGEYAIEGHGCVYVCKYYVHMYVCVDHVHMYVCIMYVLCMFFMYYICIM